MTEPRFTADDIDLLLRARDLATASARPSDGTRATGLLREQELIGALQFQDLADRIQQLLDQQKPIEQLPDGFRYRRIVVHDRMDGKRWESHQGSLDRETWVELKAICLGEAWNPPTYTVGYSMLVDETDLSEG